MKNSTNVFYLLVIVMVTGCNHQNNTTETTFYRGINGRDTADLTLSIIEKNFYGKYEVRKSWYTYRTGDIQGKINGDTLIGDFYYTPFGGGKNKRIPFALLKRDSVFLVGSGLISGYMGVPFFVPSVPINYDSSEFVLVKTNLDGTDSLLSESYPQ